ncbi:MAG: sialate O-acetylesterase [Verrucomicrobia bacterium]|nr:sialate O-acetylesterase [Verrucomicrobiota bacterium]
MGNKRTEFPADADIWVLAGQSNMAGSGFGEDYAEPSSQVWLYSLRDHWDIAREPFWADRYEAVDEAFAIMRSEIPEHLADPEYRRRKAVGYPEEIRKNRAGAGLGLPFGKAMAKFTGRPVGLIFCAKGDTRMEEWTPDYSGPACMALYKAAIRRIRAVNRPIKGVLWYQGESDTFDGQAQLYVERMKKLVTAFRRDLGRPDLPFFHVQIAACFMQTEEELPDWNLIQELQRNLESELAPGGMCAAVDLPLVDGIHLSTSSLRRLGGRLAKLVQRQLYAEKCLEIGPRPLAAERDSNDPCRLHIKYDGVNGRLLPEDRVSGFSIIETGKERNLICAAKVSDRLPATVEIRSYCPIPGNNVLWYGKGMTPFCNLVDSADMAAPVFGPWKIQESP